MQGKIYLEQTLFHQKKPYRLVIRNYGSDDIEQLIDIQRECFPPPFPSDLWWKEEQLLSHINTFPQGALCAELEGKLVGSMTALVVRYNPRDPDHTWAEITDNGYIKGAHDPEGNTLYVVDISVRPAYRFLGIGRHMMQAMYYLVVRLGLKRLLGGGRMPGYHSFAGELSPEEYIAEVVKGNLQDPVITFLLRCGRRVIKVVPDYLEDEESLNHAVLMEWPNPFLEFF